MTNALTNIQINEMMKNNKFFRGVFCKDQLKTNCRKNGYYILNLENSNQSGSHWCAFLKKDNYFLYFDSFGQPPAKEVIEIIPKNSLYLRNNRIIQDWKSSACGYFCIGFCAFVKDEKSFKWFISQFSSMTQLNDTILANLLLS